MNSKLTFLARIVVYLLAPIVSPVLMSVVGVKDGRLLRGTLPASASIQAGELPASPKHDPDKPTAVVLLGNQGSEVIDVLAPYEVLSESGAFFPRYDLEGAPPLDRVLVPGRHAASETDPAVRSWVRDNGLKPEYVHADAPAGFPFDSMLRDLAEHENAPGSPASAGIKEVGGTKRPRSTNTASSEPRRRKEGHGKDDNGSGRFSGRLHREHQREGRPAVRLVRQRGHDPRSRRAAS